MPDRIARAWIKKGVAEKYVADEADSSPFTLVEKGAGWYEIVKNGETVDKVRGEKAARERVEELRDE